MSDHPACTAEGCEAVGDVVQDRHAGHPLPYKIAPLLLCDNCAEALATEQAIRAMEDS